MTQPRFAVLFDFDGTLADSVPIAHEVTNIVLDAFGHAPITPEDLVRGMSMETPARLSWHAGVEDEERGEAMAVHFRAELLRHAATRAHLVPPVQGLVDLLDRLADNGAVFGVVSNNDVALVERMLDAWGLRARFGAIVAEGSGYPLKPDVGTTLECLRQLGVPASRAAFIGDGRADAEAARAAGLFAVGVEWFPIIRTLHADQLPLFPRRVESIEALSALLERWMAGQPEADDAQPVRALFVRHCESEANVARVLGSRGDWPLSAAGREQAATVGEWIAAHYEVEAIVSSPLPRARETAAAIARAIGGDPDAIATEERLVEHELGAFSGLTFEEAAAHRDYEPRKEWRWHWRPEGGESYADIYTRVVDFLRDLPSRAPAYPRVLVFVTHAVTMRCLYAALTNAAPTYPTWLPSNGQVWDVTFRGLGHDHEIGIFDQEYAAGKPVHA